MSEEKLQLPPLNFYHSKLSTRCSLLFMEAL